MKMEMNEEYLNRGMDLKRLALYLQKKIWLVVMLAILGATCGGIIYQVVRSMKMPVEYASVSKLYISFGNDENGDVYQYYNGYTWNDLIDTDPILDIVMSSLPGYDRDQVREATTAEILSDIRLLTITVRGDNEKFVREIRNAMESGLREYARDAEELNQIAVIRSGAPERVYWDERTTEACVTGAVILGILAMLIIGFSYVLDESVYVQEDLEKKYACRALGILTRNQKGLQPYARELKASLRYLMADKRSFAVLDMDNHADTRKLEIERLLNREDPDGLIGNNTPDSEGDFSWNIQGEESASEVKGEWEILSFNENVLSEEGCKKIREAGGVILLLPFGKDTGRKTSRILTFLKNQDCQVLGMIIAQADEEFLNRYFA
jgi:capsular polysaccharide biosynthesis protein